jgi:hypothetical protein
MARVNLYEFGDLLHVAANIGFDWNTIHNVLVNDGVVPMAESRTREHYLSDIDQYDYSDDTKKVLIAFYEAEGIDSFVLTQ